MERKNTLLLTVIAIATLLVAVVGATFAYFATQLDQDANGLNVVANTESASAVFLATGSDLSLTVEGGNMQKSQTQQSTAVLSNSASSNLEVRYGASKAGETLSCTYDIVFKWSGSGDQYLYSATETKPTDTWPTYGKEFTLTVGTATVTGFSGEGSSTTTGMAEKNIAYDGVCTDPGNENAPVVAATREACLQANADYVWTEGEVMTLVHGATIYSNTVYTKGTCSVTLGEGVAVTETNCTNAQGTWTPASGGTLAVWPITLSFYNLPVDQSHLAGRSFTGRVEVANVEC